MTNLKPYSCVANIRPSSEYVSTILYLFIYILNLSQNNLFGSLPIEVGELKLLSYLDLCDNILSREIPSSIGGCTSLVFLSFKGNLFKGTTPSSLISMRGISTLNLSHNNLSGQIPQFFERTDDSVFANASAFSVLGNNRLCGGLAKLGLPKRKETRKHKKRVPMFIIVILVATTLFTCMLGVRKKGQPSRSSSRDELFMKVSYSQLLKDTNGFSKDNLIGEGGFSSFYKGVLDHDDTLLRSKFNIFKTESVRHRNLLKIITSCSSLDVQGNDFKALTKFYHRCCIYTRLSPQSLFMDHYDLKPSNILLDDDMVAHVGDFGLARFLETNSNKKGTSGIRGTIGYALPEYGIESEMTSSGDVHSFRKLLLEVMTGKRPKDAIFNEGLTLRKFADMALSANVTDVIDDDLLKFLQEDEIYISNAKKIEEYLSSTVKLGVSCSMESPQQQMNIKNVAHKLQHIMNILQ
uniref:Protein kinase domain-containing protein n=1 Tax=Lactuca sativa TaxID=4236 RepID=A0A9R1WIK8_LACSA|nr:hypothetical protein LSAT_V11C200094770 [Lactuca sativa]